MRLYNWLRKVEQAISKTAKKSSGVTCVNRGPKKILHYYYEGLKLKKRWEIME